MKNLASLTLNALESFFGNAAPSTTLPGRKALWHKLRGTWKRSELVEAEVESAEVSLAKLRLRGVSGVFPAPRGTLTALEKIDLDVRQGEFLCIVGPSGCGKSTLLSILAGLDRPSAGEIWLDGKRVEGPGTERTVIFQELGLFPWLTVEQNVEFGLRMQRISSAGRRERVERYLHMVHLSRFAKNYIYQLSGGMKQRVALARSLATEPAVLLMDEPFAALDAQTRDLLHEELQRIWAETRKTIVFVTHNVREAVRLGDRVILLTFRPGRIKSEFLVDLPRPRQMEDAQVALLSRDVLTQLREEINKAVEEEYNVAKHS